MNAEGKHFLAVAAKAGVIVVATVALTYATLWAAIVMAARRPIRDNYQGRCG